MSAKNELQEYYQKLKFDQLPVYTYERLSNIGQEPIWHAWVSLPNGETQYDGFGRTKREADEIAARKALRSIQSVVPCQAPCGYPGTRGETGNTMNDSPPEPRRCVSSPASLETTEVLVLIDLENSPNHTANVWNATAVWCGCRIEAFAGKLSSHATKNLPSIYPFVSQFHIVDR